MSDDEHAIIKALQRVMEQSDVTLSENDVINFMIDITAVPFPLTIAEAEAAIHRHWDTCTAGCSSVPPPKCAMGVHLKRAWERLMAASAYYYTGPPDQTPPTDVPLSALSEAAASVASRRAAR